MNLMKPEIVQLLELEQKNNYFVIKKNHSYICLSDKNFCCLDISNLLASGCSYSKFLKAFQIPESKFHFPYKWFDDKAKLDWMHLPPCSVFFQFKRAKHFVRNRDGHCKELHFYSTGVETRKYENLSKLFNALQQIGCGSFCQSH